ncbi:SUR7/PalI family-domain-containing protein [Chaetomidium leptoderma]|uniref:SUR7/PalI family-domain-containing protein n=1 Tax=Chaetomidium leptoderma TaxID=669021 RepID=A0AAN6ZWT8_9PEZI|nr:SUR7/PalI family-domain-containing protein [Chaetomidium leptoderma]
MLRPATPLAVLLLAAFGLLLLSVLSTPIIRVIPLGSWQGVDFGVFGYCDQKGCTPIEIGYDVRPFSSNDFDLPSSTRSTLSSLLIVHPVAAVLTLVMFILAVVAHLHSPSHSPRYLLVLFIVGIVNFLVCLLSFLVDVLLFVPHLAWGSYVVLAATILVALSGLVSCAMRRTVVGRKARKKRIAENAEMSGENYYNRQAQQSPPPIATSTALHPTVPMVSGANGGADTLPEFASFEKRDDQSSDERIPLTTRSPSSRSPGTFNTDQTTYVNDASSTTDMAPLRSMSTTPGARDQYGNPLPPQDGYPMRNASVERMGSPGRGGMPPGGYRGRGGYPGPGRGGHNGYGPPSGGRGGYGPQGRGGYGPPPRGYGGPMRGGRTPPPPSYQGSQGPYDRRPSPAGPYGPAPYGARRASPGPPSAPGYMNQSMSNVSARSYDTYNPNGYDLPRAESPPPLPGIDDGIAPGQAAEMDASTAHPAHAPGGVGQFNLRDSDSDVAGMLALQQARTSGADRHMSDSSRYSQEENAYVPPRQAWNQGTGRSSPRVPSPLITAGRPAELPARSPPPQPAAPAGEYYEDVDPRFAEPPPIQKAPPTPIHPTDSYEDILHQGSRSPAESERSTFTSISQRGINPRWNPPMPAPPPFPTLAPGNYGANPMPRRPVPVNRSDMILGSNPDFELPSRGGGPSRS